MKLDSLSEVVRGLKAKNKQLDDFKKKIENKKMQFGQDSDELAKMIDSTKTKNKIAFNPKVLAKLGELSEYEIEMYDPNKIMKFFFILFRKLRKLKEKLEFVCE